MSVRRQTTSHLRTQTRPQTAGSGLLSRMRSTALRASAHGGERDVALHVDARRAAELAGRERSRRSGSRAAARAPSCARRGCARCASSPPCRRQRASRRRARGCRGPSPPRRRRSTRRTGAARASGRASGSCRAPAPRRPRGSSPRAAPRSPAVHLQLDLSIVAPLSLVLVDRAEVAARDAAAALDADALVEWCTCLRSPLIAATGQALMQSPQPMQRSAS